MIGAAVLAAAAALAVGAACLLDRSPGADCAVRKISLGAPELLACEPLPSAQCWEKADSEAMPDRRIFNELQ